jgi:peptidoglycan/xylan/chitin deacetylase (PgdA/CDA1 family)
MRLEDIVAAGVRRSGLEALLRRTLHRGKVGVIVYHDPTPELFERHMRFLSQRYSFVTMMQLAEALRTGSEMPANALVITFDDGHRSNRELRPIFERYGVHPTMYLCSDVIRSNGLFWFRMPGVDPAPLKLLSQTERRAVTGAVGAQSDDGLERHALTPDEVRELADVIEFGSHTASHPILPLCTDDEAADEIGRSRSEVEELSGSVCCHFSYPNGDYTEREITLARDAGYVSARTTEVGWNGPRTDPMRLRIVSGADQASVDMLATHLTGLFRLRRLIPDGLRRRRLRARVASLHGPSAG